MKSATPRILYLRKKKSHQRLTSPKRKDGCRNTTRPKVCSMAEIYVDEFYLYDQVTETQNKVQVLF